jgi:hypothetical protein
MKIAERFEDMSPKGKLKLIQQDDGDIIVVVSPDHEARKSADKQVEFCTCGGGGQSPRTLAALRELMIAIDLDNKEKTQERE